MEKLNYEFLKKSGYQGFVLKNAPEKVLQFGEGNFLRAFVNYWFDASNEKAGWNSKCCLVQPIEAGLGPDPDRRLRGCYRCQSEDDPPGGRSGGL